MAIDVYINFNGNCRDAVEFYSKVFGTEEPKIMFYGDMPPNQEFPIPEEAKNLVMHTQINIDESNIMLSDILPGMPFVAGNNITLVIRRTNMDEVKALFNKLKEGGTVEMDIQETFWSKCYGLVKDKFGIGWQLSHYEE